MEAGDIVELGTHNELVSAGGVYGKLWQSWHAAAENRSSDDGLLDDEE